MKSPLSCHILRSPLRAVGELSCVTTSSLISCFDALCSKWCKLCRTKHTSCFIRNDDTLVQQRAGSSLQLHCSSFLSLKALSSPFLPLFSLLSRSYTDPSQTLLPFGVSYLNLSSISLCPSMYPLLLFFPHPWLASHFPSAFLLSVLLCAFLAFICLSFLFALLSSAPLH